MNLVSHMHTVPYNSTVVILVWLYWLLDHVIHINMIKT